MLTPSRLKIIAAVTVFVVGVALLVNAMVGGQGHQASPSTEAFDDKDYREQVREAESKPADALAPVIERAVSRVGVREGLSPEAKASLQNAVRSTLSAYASNDIADFTAMLSAQGVAPPPVVLSNQERAGEMWKLARALLANAQIDVGSIVEGVTVDMDTASLPGATAGSVRASSRDDARPFLGSFAPTVATRSEVALPGTFVPQDGSQFEGTLVFQFSRNPETQQWVVTEIRMHGVPNGVAVIVPPL